MTVRITWYPLEICILFPEELENFVAVFTEKMLKNPSNYSRKHKNYKYSIETLILG